MTDAPLAATPRWTVWSAGFLLVAGILHLTALPAHAQVAHGLGLFFLALGAAQVVWACLALFRPSQLGARVGLAVLAVAPVVLWALTRTLRAPWSDHAEPLDILGVGTVVLEAAAAIVMVAGRAGVNAADQASPSIARRTVIVFVAVGVLLGAASYGGAMAAEASVPWLGVGEDSHHAAGESASTDADGAHEDAAPHSHAD